jgi:hypothetical protein
MRAYILIVFLGPKTQVCKKLIMGVSTLSNCKGGVKVKFVHFQIRIQNGDGQLHVPIAFTCEENALNMHNIAC